MIYQFKVNLKDVAVPVWRRLQIDSETTFKEMHYILLAAFEWSGGHLHDFAIRKSDGERMEYVFIETPKEEPFGIFTSRITQRLDEEKEKLSNWFKQEKDRAIYTYDFGDNWEHELVLEKILEAEPSETYPLCVKAKNDTPPEDSRWEMINGEIDLVNSDWKTIVSSINEEFRTEGWQDTYFDFDEFY